MEFANNVVYVVVDVNETNDFNPFVACRTMDEAKKYLTEKRKIFGPIPVVEPLSFGPSPIYQPTPVYLPTFPKTPHDPFSGNDPYYNRDFSRPRLPRHPDASFGGHGNH